MYERCDSMEKIISFLTAMVMTLCLLTCTVPLVYAENPAETSVGTELIAGNISDLKSEQFSINIKGDSIGFTTHPYSWYDDGGGYYGSVFNIDIASSNNTKLKCEHDDRGSICSFTPGSSGKYAVIIEEGFVDYYSTFFSLNFYYVIPFIIHDNIVDIDTKKIYSIYAGRSESAIVNTDKRLFKWTGGNYQVTFINPSEKNVYKFEDPKSFFDNGKALYLILSCIFEDEDHFFINDSELILQGKENQSEFYAELNISEQLSEKITFYYGGIESAFQIDLDEIGFDSIEGMKPASKLFRVFRSDIYGKDTEIFLKDSKGVTKYHVDIKKMSSPDDGGEKTEMFPETYTAVSIAENDINYDGTFNVADAVMLSRYLHGTDEMKKVNAWLADVCSDGILDVFDLCLLKKRLLR